MMRHLKHIPFAYALLVLLAGSLNLQGAGKDWLTDYQAAIEKARAEQKIVLIEFHGSDWCPPCKRLNNEVLSQKAFKDLAGESLVLVDADFPRRSELPAAQREHNEQLARKFGAQYFPTVVLVNPEGQVLDKLVGFPRGGLDGFLNFIKEHLPSES